MPKPMPFAFYLRDDAGVYYKEGCNPLVASSYERWENLLEGPLGVGSTVLRKRLSDTELAAEGWKSMAVLGAQHRTFRTADGAVLTALAFVIGPPTLEEHILATFNRFARFPHAFPNPTEGICNGE